MDRPEYDNYSDMSESRGPLAEQFAAQVLATTAPWLRHPAGEPDVLTSEAATATQASR